jgi:hypothetical protein
MASKDPLFSAVCSFFVNEFYNNVYGFAKAQVSGEKSLTDMYTGKVHAYIVGVKGVRKCYANLITELHRYCVKYHFGSLTFPEFVDKFVSKFTPPMYFEGMTKEHKDELLSSIICGIVSSIGEFVTRPEILCKIIDEHEISRAVACKMILDSGLCALCNKKDAVMHSFVKHISQSKDMVPVDVVNALRQEVQILTIENNKLKEDIAQACDDLNVYEDREVKYKSLISMLQKTKIVLHRTDSRPTQNIRSVSHMQQSPRLPPPPPPSPQPSLPLPPPPPPPPLSIQQVPHAYEEDNVEDDVEDDVNIECINADDLFDLHSGINTLTTNNLNTLQDELGPPRKVQLDDLSVRSSPSEEKKSLCSNIQNGFLQLE